VVELPSAVVIGLDSITGLHAARSLARQGVRVIGIVSDRRHPCARTNAPEMVLLAPREGTGLVDVLQGIRAWIGTDAVLMPCTDLSVLTISSARELLRASGFRFVLPDHGALMGLLDKARFVERAAAAGVAIPQSRVVRHGDDVETALDGVPLPVVVKPAIKTDRWLQATREKAFRAADRPALASVLRQAFSWTDEVVVQEEIPGPESLLATCNLIVDEDGAPKHEFVSYKLRQWPPGLGTACLAESVADPDVAALAARTLTALGFRGLGYVEVKRDPRSGTLVVIEANVGRLTGRASMAEGAGVQLTIAAYAQAAGLEPVPNAPQRQGRRRWVHLRRDLQSASRLMAQREMAPIDWLRSLVSVREEALFDVRDPLPFVADLGVGLAKLASARRASDGGGKR
jgi:D-aspartate ligase